MHIQISEMLIREIKAGRLMDGERLPPERDMAENLSISVGTLRKALGDLTEKGMLERIQGSGNYVRHVPDADSVYAFFHLELAGGGGLPTARILSVDHMTKPGHMPQFGASEMGFRIRRLRRLNETEAAFEEIWLDGACAEALPHDLPDSLYRYYREALGIWIARAEDQVGVGDRPAWAPADFLPGATRFGLVERTSWDHDGRSVEFTWTWFNPETVRFVARWK